MESVAISKFKATCLAVFEEVCKTGRPVRITQHGKPVAEVVPPGPPEPSGDWLGSKAGTARILGDVTAPMSELVAWNAERK